MNFSLNKPPFFQEGKVGQKIHIFVKRRNPDSRFCYLYSFFLLILSSFSSGISAKLRFTLSRSTFVLHFQSFFSEICKMRKKVRRRLFLLKISPGIYLGNFNLSL